MIGYRVRKYISSIVVLVFIISTLSITLSSSTFAAKSPDADKAMGEISKGKIITVRQDGSGDYTSIKDAVNTTQPGDIVVVYGGIYRETVVFPSGGNDEASRITLKAVPGEKVVITGSDIVQPKEWTADKENVYALTKDNSYFGDFNPFATKWMSKGKDYPDFYSCGCVYINGKVLSQVFKKDDVYKIKDSWFAEVTGDKTIIRVNFGRLDPTDSKNSTEINVRKQCITAAWNQGYITVDGFTVMHGSGPKTIDFWQSVAKPMAGAIATNGGYYWIIENIEATQNRGVAIDYGNGSHMSELENGGEPELYGHHIIRYCNVHDNGTNGMMAYRGAYTEIYGCTLANNNTLNTGLLSEAYIKDVSSGYGINIHNNYFYSDQDWAVYPIWLDSECDGSRVSKNVFYCKGDGHGFTYTDSEVNHGWLMWDNNIFVGVGWHLLSASHNYYVNNLWLNMPKDTSKRLWPGTGKWGFVGSEGWDGYQRAMRAMKPGTLDTISTINNETSRFETYNRYNKMLNNIFFDYGPAGNQKETEVSADKYNSTISEVYLSNEKGVNPDYSGGSWAHPEVGKLPLAWIEAEKGSVGTGTVIWGNECDYNVYYGGAEKIDYQYAAARGYEADKNSKVVEGTANKYTVTATRDTFKLTLTVDDSCSSIKAPAITGEYLGAAEAYKKLGYDFYALDVDTDFFGNMRDSKNTMVGPFANLKAGTNTFDIWPGASTGLKDIKGHMAEADINRLLSMGVISGDKDGYFKPDGSITRAQFTKMLVKAFKLNIKAGETFKDTFRHEDKDYISTAVEYGIVSGYGGSAFGPDDPVTREQMVLMVCKAGKLEGTGEAHLLQMKRIYPNGQKMQYNQPE